MAALGASSSADAILTAEEVAELLRMPRSTIYSLAQEARIPSFKVGRRWRFRKSALEQWVKEQEQRGVRTRLAGGSPHRKRALQVA